MDYPSPAYTLGVVAAMYFPCALCLKGTANFVLPAVFKPSDEQ
jgi:hypothetical protein